MSFNILLNNLANNTFYIFIILSYFARTHFHGFNLCKIPNTYIYQIEHSYWNMNEEWSMKAIYTVSCTSIAKNKK